MALLACGSFLTPVKGNTPIENNLTQAVSSVSTAVGKFDGLLPNNVHSQLTNTNISNGNTRGAIPRLKSGEKVLAKAVTAVQGAVGAFDGLSPDNVYSQLTNTNISNGNTLGAIPRLNSNAADLATAITDVQKAVGGTPIASSDTTKVIISQSQTLRLNNNLAQAVGSVNDAVGGSGNDVYTNVRNATKALTGREEILATAVTSVQGVLKGFNNAIPGKHVFEQLGSLLSKLNAYPPGITILIAVPPKGFPNLYALYTAL